MLKLRKVCHHGFFPTTMLMVLFTGTLIAQTPPQKNEPQFQQFDEAVMRLSLSPHDPYLQYVVLQLGLRDGRQQEAINAVERPNFINRLGIMGQGRRTQTNLLGTFTGAQAIQESLQLDTMRTDAQEPFRVEPVPLRGPGAPNPNPKPRPNVPDKYSIQKLNGPTVPSHPWEKLLGNAKPDVGTLSKVVPEDFYFAEFKSVSKLHDVMATGDLWSGHILTQMMGDARTQDLGAKIKKQLGLNNLSPKLIDQLGVESVAVTGSDPFLAEGSDVTILLHGKNIVPIVKQMDSFKENQSVAGEHIGIAYQYRSNAASGINVYTANPRPDLHVRSNSKPAFLKVLQAVAGINEEGKAVRRLGDSAEFQYVRTRMPRNAVEEDGFVYLSDSFIRHLVGPQLKLTERRRSLVANHLRMIGHAALLFRSEHGRAPKSLEELVTTKCAPDLFGKGKLAHPDGGKYSLSEDGMTGICSKYGRLNAFAPCLESQLTEITKDEADAYKLFVAEYSDYWRTFFDPIAIRVSMTPQQNRLETLVLPLIDNSIYTDLARGAGKPMVMDVLPTPKREIGGIWIHFDKKPINQFLGNEQDKTQQQAPDTKRFIADRARSQNSMQQIGIAHHAYHDAMGRFPSNISDKKGKALLSWRVAILPYLEQDELYRQFKQDEPWDSEHNKKLIEKIPAIYQGRMKTPRAEGKTAFLRPAGKGTLFPPDRAMRMAEITDGTSNTIMTVEVNEESSAVWTKPDDYIPDPKNPLKPLIRKGETEFLVGMADGSVRTVRVNMGPNMFMLAISPNDGRLVDLDGTPEVNPRTKSVADVQSDLKQIGLAMMNYESAFARFPTTNIRDAKGKPLLSWRVAILPYLEQSNLYEQFKLDEPWDSEHNRKLIEKIPAIYQSIDAKLNEAGKTRYVIPSGKGTLSPPEQTKITIASIVDGLSNTLMACYASPDSAVIWTKPDDLPFNPQEPLKGLTFPGQDAIDVLRMDGSVIRLSPQIEPQKFASMVTPAGGEAFTIEPNDEMMVNRQRRTGSIFDEFRLDPRWLKEMEKWGFDVNKLRRLVKDGIGDHLGFHMHDAPRLFDSDFSGLFGGDAENLMGNNFGLVLRFTFGPSSISVPVKDPKIVDEFLDELDRFILSKRYAVSGVGMSWSREVDFYKVAFPPPHQIRSVVLNIVGLKWRIYWGRIGNGLYIATRPFILEDLAAAEAAKKYASKSEPSHVLFRVRPENWSAVMPGYNLGWSESLRKSCHGNLVTVENVARGWNDRKPVVLDANFYNRVDRIYGGRPSCPDGGKYELSADGRNCRCSIHGDVENPRQPQGPSAASSTGRVLKTLGGLSASIRFEDDGLHVIVIMDRK
ncbi:MAG: DUF1559 domain-containing protein [Gemmataceae bacterium]